MTDWKKLGEDKLELKAAWEGLEIPFEYPTKQIPLWLLDYGKEMIISGFKTLKKKAEKISDPEAYLGTILRNAKRQNMTPEERQTEISQMRSAVGKLGAAKRHEKEVEQIKQEFAQVCQDLPHGY
jgi:hypothetical protein